MKPVAPKMIDRVLGHDAAYYHVQATTTEASRDAEGPPTETAGTERNTCQKCTGSPSRSAGRRSRSRPAGWPSRPPAPSSSARATRVVLNTATAGNLRDVDFLPLTVDVEERMYAAGKIPGSFFKREGRAGEKATLIARMIDRPLRPLFPKGWRRETQLVGMPLSVDQVHPYDVLAMNGASAALAGLRHPVPGARSAPCGSARSRATSSSTRPRSSCSSPTSTSSCRAPTRPS